MANSFIFTRDGLSVIVDNLPYNAEKTHPNYNQIIECLRSCRWSEIPGLLNVAQAVQLYVHDTSNVEIGSVKVDCTEGVVYYKDQVIHNTVTDHILEMMRDNFPFEYICKFLDRLMLNPSKKAVEELYGWMTHNGMTIDQDGFLLAYKRVDNNFRSFYDGKTLNAVGTLVELPRNAVDDRSEVTCSTGLHFCSQEYLPNYCGGQGQVVLLQIDPADVVSIPVDYNFSKGRACKYFVLKALTGDARQDVEQKDVMPQPVITDQTDVNKSNDYKIGYADGYKDGRGKQRRTYRESDLEEGDDDYTVDDDYIEGYCAGYSDGRAKNPKLY